MREQLRASMVTENSCDRQDAQTREMRRDRD